MLCQFILGIFRRFVGGVEAGAGCAGSELLLEEVTKTEATAPRELLSESIREHVTVDVAGRATFLAEHRRHRGAEELANEDGLELLGDLFALVSR